MMAQLCQNFQTGDSKLDYNSESFIDFDQTAITVFYSISMTTDINYLQIIFETAGFGLRDLYCGHVKYSGFSMSHTLF